ncbi:hypothetical protein EV356DRAFT_516174 [Viridothelium virens]|uniref:Cell cycle control protein cwf19 n=1 Tax=Viridothelium virens TaxID=1048519 RepID=A0A6A6H6C6_VIRVR|nr:hypothetical protein EV356DRAFT_516174 [Viridothelium virens]
MALEDFEKELAESKTKHSHRKRERSRSRDRERHHHHHRSSKNHLSKRDHEDSPRHRSKRSRRHDASHDNDAHEHLPKRRHKESPPSGDLAEEDEEDEWVEKEAMNAPPTDQTFDAEISEAQASNSKRDSWMEAPSTLDIDYVQRRKEEPKPSRVHASKNDYELKIHKNELNHHLKDLHDGKTVDELENEPAQHEVNYVFGDAGSQWRMMKLKAVYRQAKESGRPIEEIAEERFGDIRSFDDAREEEIELDRRKMYGNDYVGKNKPSGELFEERKIKNGFTRDSKHIDHEEAEPNLPQGEIMEEQGPLAKTVVLDQTALNKLKAQMMKAKLKCASNAAELEAEYNNAMSSAANRKEPEVVVLGAMESRMLAGGRKGEVKAVDTKRGRERGLVEENEDMSIEDMVRQEKRTRGTAGGEGRVFAERIAKDGKFDNDLDYIDDNASKLAKRVQRSEINLRNTAISDFQKITRILDTCPLCHHEDTDKPPVAPILSLATRVYLTLPTEPEINEEGGGACIIPIQHRFNLLECDDDEWEEIRNFMKCLTRMYHDQGRDVVFYENAAHQQRKRHASLEVVPIPFSLGETAPAFFKEAILSADEEWTQHKKIIDTLAKSREGQGKLAFRRSIAKEMPYFHVWFELDGGLGHIVEDQNRWPKGDLFAREILGGMLDAPPDVIKKQGRWHRDDPRTDGFKKLWRKFDWTRVLTDG